MNYLHISELFYSIQGEGATMGTPAIFIRLGGCNMLCKSEHWVCDTIEVWSKSSKVEFENVLTPDQIQDLRSKKVHLIFTGGEPLLHQSAIKSYLIWIERVYGFNPICEIETNGTIMPTDELYYRIAYWNVSPKLSNSGVEMKKRKIAKVIKWYSRAGKRKVIFKFVITSKMDVEEIYDTYALTTLRNVYLMPGGATRAELDAMRPLVVELCKRNHFKYSERLQVVIWDKATGV
jgi:organic radical activating enzyme